MPLKSADPLQKFKHMTPILAFLFATIISLISPPKMHRRTRKTGFNYAENYPI